jgi:hypothetical protein
LLAGEPQPAAIARDESRQGKRVERGNEARFMADPLPQTLARSTRIERSL